MWSWFGLPIAWLGPSNTSLNFLDECDRLKIELVSLRESLDTGGPLGRAVRVIVGAIAELERSSESDVGSLTCVQHLRVVT